MMARAAPGQAARSGTSPRLVGDVFLTGNRFGVAFHHLPTRSGFLGLPIVMQSGPLHRSHVVLGADELPDCFGECFTRGRVLVLSAQPFSIPPGAEPFGEMAMAALRRIEETIRRCRQATMAEAA